MKKPLLIAHRGDTKQFPENTVLAFESAFAIGADGIEFDVQESDLGEFIVVHNYLYDRSKEYPKFDAILKQFSPRGFLEIEIKSLTEDSVQKIAKMIEVNKLEQYKITSSVLPILPVVRKYLPKAMIGMIFNRKNIEGWMTEDFLNRYIEGYLSLTKANVLHLDIDFYTLDRAKYFHEKGYLLHTHLKTADKTIFQKVIDLGIDHITTDDVEGVVNLR